MLTQTDFRKLISKSILENKSARVTMNHHRLSFGKFIEDKDMESKGWFRFIPANGSGAKLYNIANILWIDLF